MESIAGKSSNAPKADGNGEGIPAITVIPGSTGDQDELPLGDLDGWEEV
jgi:hypothetical protein